MYCNIKRCDFLKQYMAMNTNKVTVQILQGTAVTLTQFHVKRANYISSCCKFPAVHTCKNCANWLTVDKVIAIITRKPCCRKETARCRSCSFRFISSPTTFATRLRVAKFQKPGFRAPNIPAQNGHSGYSRSRVLESVGKCNKELSNTKY